MRTVVAALLLVALVACGSPNSVEAGPELGTLRVSGPGGGALTMTSNATASASSIDFPLDAVWRVLPAAFDSVGLTVTKSDPAVHLVSNGGVKLRRQLRGVPLSRYIDCGGTQIGPSADSYDVVLTVQTQVQSNGTAASTVATSVEAVAKAVAFSGEYAACNSTGKLEARLADVIKAKLGR